MSGSVVSPVFISRRDELTSLVALMRKARAGEPAFALIGGEAGVGKTRLISELNAEAAQAGFRVLTGQCLELGAEGLPLAPLADALRTLARSTPPEELADALGPAWNGLARLLPEPMPGSAPGPAAADIQTAQLLELVLGLLTRLSSTRPVLFVFEDLHWADQSTLDLIAFLVRSLRDAPVFLIATYRSDELHRRHRLRPLLTSWERVRSVDRFELRRFEPHEVAEQLAAILGGNQAPAIAAEVFDRSGGNAYLVEELAGVIASGGDPGELPPSLRDVLLSRVDTLSPAAQQVLRVASVAGRTVTDRLLAAVAAIPEAEFFAALRETVENHLLRTDHTGRGYAFRHALTRDAVYDDMLPGERVRLHAAYGEVLESESTLAAADAVMPAALAHHWYAALDLPRALPAMIDAASHAMATYAPAEALHHLGRALEIWPRVPDATDRTGIDLIEVFRLAAEAAYRAGEVGRSRSLLDAALDDLPPDFDPVRLALLLERRAEALRDGGQPANAEAQLRKALELLPAGQASRAQAVVLAALAHSLARLSDLPGASDVAGRAVAAARAAGAKDVEADAAICLGSTEVYLTSDESGLRSLRSGLELALDINAPITAMIGYINLSDVLEFLGRHEEAAQLAAEGLELAARAGLTRTLGPFLTGNQAEPLIRAGLWTQAEKLLKQGLDVMPEGVFAAGLELMTSELAAMRGRFDEAASALRAAKRTLGETTDIQFAQPVAYNAALIALGSGDRQAARDSVAVGLASGTDVWGSRYAWPLLWLGLRVEAEEMISSRDRRQDVPPASEQRRAELAATAVNLLTKTPPAIGYQAMAAAEQSRGDGPATPSAVGFREDGSPDAFAMGSLADDLVEPPVGGRWPAAVGAWRDAGEPYLLAYCLVRLAEACLAAGARTAAVEAIREAHELAAKLGAEPLVAEAAAFARRLRLNLAGAAAGPAAEPAPVDELDRFGLTQREREVLLLVAAGRSNSEIAQALFISSKTASVHVSNILAKLGVAGRVEAAALAHRLGIVS
jgi:DNA-binding CsgD family transcriptional regulator